MLEKVPERQILGTYVGENEGRHTVLAFLLFA